MTISQFALRPLGEQDLDTVLAWRNSAAIRENMYSDRPIATEEHRLWYAKMSGSDRADYRLFEFAGRPLGLVYFTDIDRANEMCLWGFYLGERERPPRSGLILGILGLDHAFGQLALRKVCGECFAFNSASTKFHEQLGFKREGCFVEHFYRRGSYQDIIRYAIFRPDWVAKRPEALRAAAGGRV